MKTWTEVRDKKVEELSLKQGKTSLETTTFKPSINDKSQVMMKKKTTRVPVYEQEPKVRKIQVDKNCTFKPNLSKALKK